MSVRPALLALSCLALTACDGNPFDTAARTVACACPAPAAAPAAAPVRAPRSAAPRPRATGGARLWRVRTEPVVVREAYGDTSADQGLSGGYGGRYGARGGGSAGVTVSVQESESASERYSYRESSSAYGYSSVSGGVVTSGAPQQPYVRYKSASTTPGGWLEWPGKVED